MSSGVVETSFITSPFISSEIFAVGSGAAIGFAPSTTSISLATMADSPGEVVSSIDDSYATMTKSQLWSDTCRFKLDPPAESKVYLRTGLMSSTISLKRFSNLGAGEVSSQP